MSKIESAFVFIHGAWHCAATWDKILRILEARGHVARALDLPGAGAHAKAPSSYGRRPFDSAAFASDPSPNAGVTQEERTSAVVNFVEETRRQTGASIVLVGHSLGGLTLTSVAETIPESLRAAVYVGGFMIPPGLTAGDIRQHPSMSDSLVRTLLKANPNEVGAMRIDPRSEDAAYVEQIRLTFYGDVSADEFAKRLLEMHCDEPRLPYLAPTVMTADRFGRVPRHYFRCLEDRAIPVAAQDFMISEVDLALGNQTHTHAFATSHSPFVSQSDAVVDTLLAIAN